MHRPFTNTLLNILLTIAVLIFLSSPVFASSVGLTWGAPASGGPVDSYTVYRSTATCAAAVTFAALPAGTGVTVLTFTDLTVANSTTYCYYVTAKNTAGESGPSPKAQAIVPAAPPPPPGIPQNLSVTSVVP